MKSSGPGRGWWSRAARAGALATLFAMRLMLFTQPAHADDQSPQALSLNQYIDRLKSLDSVVANCQKEYAQNRGMELCDPAKVGADLHVSWSTDGAKTEREIRFGWLRLLLQRAREKDRPAPVADSVQPPVLEADARATSPATVDTLLAQARDRLSDDERQAETIAGISPPSRLNRDRERKSLNTILAQKEYKSIAQISWKERLVNALDNWLNQLFTRLADDGSRWKWVALAFRILWIGALCVGLAWFLIRIERRSRARPNPDAAPFDGAPSAREWQLWLADAQSMAAEGQWREAIHLIYWASISRLESRRLWPADRARTPREYLVLLPKEDARKASLSSLTHTFERTWYGGQEAVSSDYRTALKLAAELGVA